MVPAKRPDRSLSPPFYFCNSVLCLNCRCLLVYLVATGANITKMGNFAHPAFGLSAIRTSVMVSWIFVCNIIQEPYLVRFQSTHVL